MAPLRRTTAAGESGTASSSDFEKNQHVNAYSYFVIFFITLSSAAYGYAGSIIATTLTQPSFIAHMKLDKVPNAQSLIGAMNGLYYAGGIFGSFFAGWCNNRIGRKMSVTIGNALLLISGALLTASVNPAMFIAFRFVSGIGVPLWIAELAPPKVRGILSDIHAVFMMAGYAIASYVGLGFYFVGGTNQWRGAMVIQVVLPTIILCGIYWMPESPRYLLSKDRIEEARSIIYHIHSNSSDPSNEFAKREFYQMQKQMELDKTFATSYWDIVTQSSMMKRALTTMFLEFCLMSSGVLVILNYGSIIWASLGFDTVQILNFQGGFQLTGLVFNIVAMTFVDKVKRPHLMAGGFLLTAIIMAVEMALQRYYLGTSDRGGLIACATFILLFQTSYSLFLDGPTFFYVAEIWPSHVRPQGFAIGMSTMSLTNLTWLMAAPTAFDSISWHFYLFFVCIPIFGSVIIFLFFKDTLHKPLEEIAAVFGDADMVAVYQRELNTFNRPLESVEKIQARENDENKASAENVENAEDA